MAWCHLQVASTAAPAGSHRQFYSCAATCALLSMPTSVRVYYERTTTIDEAEDVKQYLAATGLQGIYSTNGHSRSTSLRKGGLDDLV